MRGPFGTAGFRSGIGRGAGFAGAGFGAGFAGAGFAFTTGTTTGTALVTAPFPFTGTALVTAPFPFTGTALVTAPFPLTGLAGAAAFVEADFGAAFETALAGALTAFPFAAAGVTGRAAGLGAGRAGAFATAFPVDGRVEAFTTPLAGAAAGAFFAGFDATTGAALDGFGAFFVAEAGFSGLLRAATPFLTPV